MKKKKGILAIVFAKGGTPRLLEVEPDNDDRFEVDDMTFEILAGSTWEERGRTRVICHEGNPFTINGQTLAGDAPVTAKHLALVARDNLMSQIWALVREKPWYTQASTWIIAGAIGLLALMAFWATQTIGSGFEGVERSLDTLQISGGPKTPEAAGHNRIGGN